MDNLPHPNPPIFADENACAMIVDAGDTARLFKSGTSRHYCYSAEGRTIRISSQIVFSDQDAVFASMRADLLQYASSYTDIVALSAMCSASRLDRCLLLDSSLPGYDLHDEHLLAMLPALADACRHAQPDLPLALRHLQTTRHADLLRHLSDEGWLMMPAGMQFAISRGALATGNNLYLRHDLTLSEDECQLLSGSALTATDFPRLSWLANQSSLKSLRYYLPDLLPHCAAHPECRIHALKLGNKLVAMMITRQAANSISLIALGCDPALSAGYAAERRLLIRLYLDAKNDSTLLLYPAELADYCRLRGIPAHRLQHGFQLGHLPARQRLAATALLEVVSKGSRK